MSKRKRTDRINSLLNKLLIDHPIPIMEMPRLWKTAERMADAGVSDDDIAFVMKPMIEAITVNTLPK